jgi:hypothetical protein
MTTRPAAMANRRTIRPTCLAKRPDQPASRDTAERYRDTAEHERKVQYEAHSFVNQIAVSVVNRRTSSA